MKKLLGILVLGLLWCNVGFSKTLELICKDNDDKSFPLIITIVDEGELKYGIWNGSKTNLLVSDTNYSLYLINIEDNFDQFITIDRYGGGFLANINTGNNEFKHRGKCEERGEPKF